MTDSRFTGSAYYRSLGERKLVGSRCLSCEAWHLPPRPMCPVCYGEDMEPVEMGGEGRLLAFTTIHIAPTAMIEAGYGRNDPYCVGIVQLAEGPAISAQILGVDPARPEEIEIGMPLRATFVRRGREEQVRTYLAFEKKRQDEPTTSAPHCQGED